MVSRVAFMLIALFWVGMNVLLWRSEYGGRNHLGSTVAVETVMKKVLTAPDPSSLEIIHHGVRIGYCRWVADVGMDPRRSHWLSDQPPPEGRVEGLSDYRIDFEGNLSISEITNRVRFDLSLRISTNLTWQEFDLRANTLPTFWQVYTRAADKSVRMQIQDPDGRMERVFTYAELQNPAALMQELEVEPWARAILTSVAAGGGMPKGGDFSLGLPWDARTDWINIGHTSVRVYRMQARLLDRFKIVVIVSQVGEILRVELPDDLILVNEQLLNL